MPCYTTAGCSHNSHRGPPWRRSFLPKSSVELLFKNTIQAISNPRSGKLSHGPRHCVAHQSPRFTVWKIFHLKSNNSFVCLCGNVSTISRHYKVFRTFLHYYLILRPFQLMLHLHGTFIHIQQTTTQGGGVYRRAAFCEYRACDCRYKNIIGGQRENHVWSG